MYVCSNMCVFVEMFVLAESFTTVFRCDCNAVYPGLLLAIPATAQATSNLEKKLLTAFPNSHYWIWWKYLRVIYTFLESDWLVQNLEIETRNLGRSTHTYFFLLFPRPFSHGHAQTRKNTARSRD